MTNSGGPPTLVATTLRSIAMPSRVACLKGSIRDGWQSTSPAAIQAGTCACGMRPVTRTLGRSTSSPRSGPSPTNASRPRPKRWNASASRTVFLRSISEPTQTKAGPSPSQFNARRAGAAGRGLKVSRSTPQSATSSFAAAAGILSARRVSSQRELAISALAWETIPRVAVSTPLIRPRLATSWPWAMTTNGARETSDANAPAAPAGKRKCANMTSGRVRSAPPTASALRRAYLVGGPPRRLMATTSVLWPIASSSRLSGTRKLPRSGFFGLGHIWVTNRIRKFTPL